MESLARFLVQKPLHIVCVAFALLLLGAVLRWRSSSPRGANALLVAAVGWLGYAGWESLVLIVTPEADIRVDLLVIWPLVAILTLWAIVRVAFARKATLGETSEERHE